MIFIVILQLIVFFNVSPLHAATYIRCHNQAEQVKITLSAMRKFSSTLNCISGSFVADMTPCAPNGGFGLSYPTGQASLSRVVMRWQDYGDHMGGVVGNHVNGQEIVFSGGYMSPGDGYHSGWLFTVDRLSGTATLKTFKDEIQGTKDGVAQYTCSSLKQKL